jgi:hypothetical protein
MGCRMTQSNRRSTNLNRTNRQKGLWRRMAGRASYLGKWLPAYGWQRLTRKAFQGRVHLIITLADHFEPSIIPTPGAGFAPLDEQERRVEIWCREFPQMADRWRDGEGRPFNHTYFFPAEQYERSLVDRLAAHCRAGWGELEIHLHHGMLSPDTAENTRRQLEEFRDILAARHGCLCYLDETGPARYAFVHGNFALANSAGGKFCGVDNELTVLSETGCYADLTMPASAFHPAQIGKVNSLYECGLPLNQTAAHRRGRDLEVGRKPEIFPIMVQGPLMLDFDRSARSGFGRFENASLTGVNPPSLRRLRLWKQAGICVQGRPEWLFIKLHTHSMDPTQQEGVLGAPMRQFLGELIEGAKDRGEMVHFASAREMVNMILAACDGREGNPGDYRDYRLRMSRAPAGAGNQERQSMTVRG